MNRPTDPQQRGITKGPRPGGSASPWVGVAGGLLIGLAVTTAFWPSLRGEFLWDDDTWITATPTTPTHRLIHAGDGLRGIWLSNQTQDYWPLSNSAFWLEWRWWGMHPTGYRAVNLVLHTLGAVLVWRLACNLGVPWAWLGALLFAVHPVTVASVAWIAELKNCLSLPLAAAALLCWLRFDASRRWTWYAASLLAFVLALTAKTSTVIVPPILLACGWWRRGRIGRQDILLATPFFLLALAMGLVTLSHQATGDVVPGDAAADGLLARIAASGWAVWFYLWKAVLPVRLAMLYPRWTVDPGSVVAWLPLVALVGAAAGVLRLAPRWRRPVAMGLGCYLLALAPVLGILPMWFRRYALVSDHLQYPALPAVTMLAAAGLATAAMGSARRRHIAVAAAAVLVLGFMTLTWQRSAVFTSTIALMQDSLAKNPDSWTAHTNLGAGLAALGRPQEAIGHYEAALRLRPTSFQAHNNLAATLFQSGRPDQAVEHYREALRINPDVAEIHANLGLALALQGRLADASHHFREVLRLAPTSADAHNNLGYMLLLQGLPAEAIPHFEEALRLNPADDKARDNLRRARDELQPQHGGETTRSPGACEMRRSPHPLRECGFLEAGRRGESDRLAAALTGADPHALVHRQHEDLSVADLAVVARTAAADDGCDRRLDELVVHRDLQLHLPHEVHGDLVPPVGLGVAALTAEALHVEHREAKHLHLGQRLFHALQLPWLDDRDDELHGGPPFKRSGPRGYLAPQRHHKRTRFGSSAHAPA